MTERLSKFLEVADAIVFILRAERSPGVNSYVESNEADRSVAERDIQTASVEAVVGTFALAVVGDTPPPRARRIVGGAERLGEIATVATVGMEMKEDEAIADIAALRRTDLIFRFADHDDVAQPVGGVE